ncbi:MAG: amidohydrolase [Acidobacteriota bacterium]|nr:amidohydrolase [Acidobacteriota bacterium]
MPARVAVLLLLVPAVPACTMRGEAQPAPVVADLLLTHAKVVTVDEGLPQAEAVAIRGDRILALGSAGQLQAHVGATTRVIDLRGQLVIPGFTESHGHFSGLGEAQLQLDLMGAGSWEQILGRVAAAAKGAKPGEWIVGRGWHQEKWDAPPRPGVEGFPTHASLDAVSPDNPVLLTHASGHAVFVNARAMALAGMTRATPSPPGGEILKDAAGEPTGLLRETAADLVQLKAADGGRERKRLEIASAAALAKGITSFHDAGSRLATIDLMRQMIDEGRIGVRLWVMVSDSNAVLAERLRDYRTIDYGNAHLTVRAIKRQIDGALGSRGAWLLEPYADKPDSTGLNTTPIADLQETVRLALASDYQLAVHAIGDRANRETLDLFERAFRMHPAKKDLRWRVEHAQHLALADIPRFGQLGIIASMQGVHCTSDAPYVVDRLGSRRAEDGAYVWQKLMETGAVIANGTDAPVEDVDPIAGYYATVSRRTSSGRVFYADQRMSRMDALRSYTINGAYAAFEDQTRGSLTVGKLADLTVLSKDILTIPEDQIRAAQVTLTMVGGKILYER